jgi:hypothetical protein
MITLTSRLPEKFSEFLIVVDHCPDEQVVARNGSPADVITWSLLPRPLRHSGLLVVGKDEVNENEIDDVEEIRACGARALRRVRNRFVMAVKLTAN